MYANGLKLEGTFNYSFVFCHACLTPNRNITMVGDYVDIYQKICDNVRMDVTSHVGLCWECMTMLRKILAFRIKVQNAQQLLNYHIKNQTLPLGLTSLMQSGMESTSYPEDEVYEVQSDTEDKEDQSDIVEDNEDQSDTAEDKEDQSDTTEDSEELMIQIQDVKGHYDLSFDSSSDCDATPEVEEERRKEEERRREEEMRMEEERRQKEEEDYRCWKRTVLLVLKRICGHRYAHHFLKPVSDEYAPLYSKIIKRPTDLGTIKKQINSGIIRTTEQLKRELLLMFSNAFIYNSSHHEIFKMTLELRAETIHELSLLSAAQSDFPQPPPIRLRRASVFRDSTRLSAESFACQATPPARQATPPARQATPPARPAPRRRRTSTCSVCDDDVTVARTTIGECKLVPDPPAATVRRRRRSEWSRPTTTTTKTTTTTAATIAGSRRSSSGWNWTTLDLDTEFLEPRHFGKICKAVL